ncbi:hypothetical protein SAMN04487895_10387 [Paenibacillus sophorae]|uniref:Uncharacterized protein n=1 Tax=Paenibacillus sophorae TaxID=1333845 RepID=A0A1H8JP53_9BACL|nr:hypothetical protein [Paenibacillus sophorae]QWU13423.1 hypothetical protein KP014_15595 [Paenibacillus sophorae]SEN82106.1 hypothetical protein SAMN04487895_10387 [Paenibacillus sophorae]
MNENYNDCMGTPMYGFGYDNSVHHILVDTNAEDEKGNIYGEVFIVGYINDKPAKVVISSFEKKEAFNVASYLSKLLYVPILEDDGENKKWIYEKMED